MAWSVLQSAGNPSATLTATATLATNLSSGSKLVAYVCNALSMTISTVKDGAGNSFSQISSNVVGTTDASYIYVLDTPAGDVGAATTITATWTGTANGAAIIVQEVSGLAAGSTAAACLDGTPAKTSGSGVLASGGTSLALGAYASAAASEYLIILYADDGDTSGSTGTLPTGYTADTHNVSSSSADDLRVYFKNSTGGTEAPTTITVAGGGQSFGWTATFIAFKLAAAAGPQAPGQEARLPLIPPGMFPPGSSRGLVPQSSDPSLGPPPPFPGGKEFIPATTPLIVPPFLTPASWSQPWAPRTDPGVVPPGTPSQYQFLLALASQASSGIAHPLTLTATALAAQPAEQVSLGKNISNPVSVFSSARKALGKNISSPVSVFSSVKNSVAKTLAAIAVAFSVINVRIGRLISGQLAALASVSMQKVKLLTLAAQAVASSAVTRQVSRTLSGITAATGSVTRQALRTLAAQAAAFTTTTRRLLRTLPGQAAVTGTSQSKTGRLLSGVAAATAGTARQAGKGISGVTATAGTVTRSITRTLNAVSAVLSSTSLIKVKLLALVAQVAATGAEKISLGKILSGITVAYSSLQNSLGKRISGTTTVTGSTIRGTSRLLSGVTAASGIITIVKVKLLTLAAQIAAYGTQKVSLGKIIQGNTVTYAATRIFLSKNIAAAVTATGDAARSISKILTGTVSVFSSVLANTGTRSIILAAQVVTYGIQKISLGQKIQVILVTSGAVQDAIRKNMITVTVTAGTAVRSVGKKISGITAMFSSVSSIKVKLLTLVSQVAVFASTTRKISPVISAQVTATGVTIRSASRKIAAQTVFTGQAVNSLGKKISGTAVAFSSAATQKIRPLVLSAITAVTNAVTRRVGSIQPGTVTASSSAARGIARKIAAAMAVNSTVIAGRAFLVKLTAITATSASVVVKISQSAFVIAFKLGTPVFRWITGGLKKVWRIP